MSLEPPMSMDMVMGWVELAEAAGTAGVGVELVVVISTNCSANGRKCNYGDEAYAQTALSGAPHPLH